MTAYRFVTLTCDGTRVTGGVEHECGEICDPGMATTVREARRAAAAEGWRHQGGLDLCPRHFGYHSTGYGWERDAGDAG